MEKLKFNDDIEEREDLQTVWDEVGTESANTEFATPERAEGTSTTGAGLIVMERPSLASPIEVRQVEMKSSGILSGKERYTGAYLEQITPESTREYGEDRREENLRMLEVTGNSQLAELYEKVLEENPELCVVKLVNIEEDGNASFNWAELDRVTGQVLPMMMFNFSHPETYRLNAAGTLLPLPEKLGGKSGIKFTMKRLALKMGADWRRCARNKKITTGMAFLHELGHAKDFIDNYLTPDYLMRKGMSSGERMAESVVAAAVRREGIRRMYDSQQMGQQVSRVEMNRAYRERPDEKCADEFALDYLLDHHDEYFVEEAQETTVQERPKEMIRGQITKEPSEERVKMEFGREIPMDADFAYIMGLTEGNMVKVEPVLMPEKVPSPNDMKEGEYGIGNYEGMRRYDENGYYISRHEAPKNRVGRHEKPATVGRLMRRVKEGGAIYLNSATGAVRACENASGFRYVPFKDVETGKVRTEVYFNDETERKYRIERVKE